MQRLLIILLILFFTVTACEKSEDQITYDFESEIQIKLGQTINSNDNKSSIKITEINDSRCPSDVVCVWQGEAQVTFEFTYGAKTNLVLSTFEPQADTIDNFIFRLIEVTPYPISTSTIELEDYTVSLEISEL